MSRHTRLGLALFFGSGASALAYETVWIRQLILSYGVSVYAVSAVLSAYMFGLCAGAYFVGKWAARIANPLRVYGYFELAIALYAFFLYFILADFMPGLYRAGFGVLADLPYALNVARFGATLLLLVLPTALMGGTLPVLSLFLRQRDASIGASIGWLYGINTLGGCVGTGVAGFWLLKDLGIFRTTLVAIAFNLAIVAVALWLSRDVEVSRPADRAEPPEPEPAKEPRGERGIGHRLPLLVLLFSGYASLSYEVLWNRTLLLYTHNSTYAFSIILIVFLLGIALGSLAYVRNSESLTDPRILGIVQLCIAGFVWLSIHLTGALPFILGGVTSTLGAETWLAAVTTIVVSAALVVFPPTFLMGMTFPIAAALSAPRRSEIGSVTGTAYAVLTVGNILGSLITGFVLIEWIGLRNSFGVAMFLNLLGGFLLLLYRPGQTWRLVPAVAGAVAFLAVILSEVDPTIFRSYYEAFLPKILFYKEEITDNVIVHEDAEGHRRIYYSDGRGTAGTNTEAGNRIRAHIPMLLHPNPQSVVSIGFGVGNSLSALAQHEPEKLACVELSPGAIEAAPYFPTNHDVLSTPNLEIHIEDGRNYLLRSEDRFDVIQLDPPELHEAGVVNLYTRDFYEIARDRLTEEGIVCQWFTTLMPEHELKMVIRAFLEVFPEGSLWSGDLSAGLLMIGGSHPIRATPERFLARANRPPVLADLKAMKLGPLDVMARHLLGPASLAAYVADVPSITDDRTYIDFSIPRSSEAGFGVFIYNTFQEFTPDYGSFMPMVMRLLELEAQGESPLYLFDLSATDSATGERFERDLAAAVDAYRSGKRAVLRRLVDQGLSRRP